LFLHVFPNLFIASNIFQFATLIGLFENIHFAVPLLSRILPSDTCKVFKKGCSIRYDVKSVRDKEDSDMLKIGKEYRRNED